MPHKIHYDRDSKTIFIKRKGLADVDDFLDGMNKILQIPEFKDAKVLFSDLSDVTLKKVNTAKLKKYSRFCNENVKNVQGMILAPDNLTYGICRVFEAFSNLTSIMIFRELDDVLNTLSIKELPKEIL